VRPSARPSDGVAPSGPCQLPWLEVDARLEGVELVAADTDGEVSVTVVVVVVVSLLTEVVPSLVE
jgi:hypothetical protein